MPVVCMYCRVSDIQLKDDGERRQDIQRQVERLRPYVDSWIKMNPGWTMGEIYLDDGKSAFNEDYNSRPAFKRLLGEMRAHRVQKAFVESLDRVSRNVVNGLSVLYEMDKIGGNFTSIAEGEIEVTTPMGWMRTTFGLMMAEWSSRDKSWKVTHALGLRKLNKNKICKSCFEKHGVDTPHMGRHPDYCECLKCLKRKAVEPKKGLSSNWLSKMN